tara:strand:+ start:202 stop:405 length:204 start_codon:yes stop_codon:yes gene_type:complete
VNTKRLAELKNKKSDVKWPSFSDIYQTSTADGYMAWMLANNPELTEQDILDLNIIRIDRMYKENPKR